MGRDRIITDVVLEAISTAKRVIPTLPTVHKALSNEGEKHVDAASDAVKLLAPLRLQALVLSAAHQHPDKEIGKDELKAAHQRVMPLPPHCEDLYEALDGKGVKPMGELVKSRRGGFSLNKEGHKALETLCVAHVIDIVKDLKNGEGSEETYITRVEGDHYKQIHSLLEVPHVNNWWDGIR